MDNSLSCAVFIVSFVLISWFVIRTSKTVKTGRNFSVADRSLTSAQVSWVIIGTLVGGISTIGTVQAAYDNGVAAWIFTLGSGISCFVLGCFFAGALRREKVVTVSEFLGHYFGERFQYYSSFFNSLGMFIHIVAQYLAAMAILQSVFGFSQIISVLITTGLMALFVLSGGIAGAGTVGRIKFFMLYGIMVLSAGLALRNGGGFEAILARLPQEGRFLNFFSYGVNPTLIDMGSMIVGVLSTQIYLQAIFSAKTVKQARNGAFLSALVIPPIGILGIIIGLYLRAYHPELGADSAQALPFFFKLAFPSAIAALFSAGLLLVVLGSGAGLVLGVTTNLYMDVISKMPRLSARMEPLVLIRSCALGVIVSSSAIVITGLDSTILKWSYLSMGLRGASVFAGLFVVIFMGNIKESRATQTALYLIPLLYMMEASFHF